MSGRPYVWRGGDDDSRETQIRHRVAIARQRAAELVVGPDPEWYREMLAEQADDIAAVLSPDPPPAATGYSVAPRCRGCGYLTSAAGHQRECGASDD